MNCKHRYEYCDDLCCVINCHDEPSKRGCPFVYYCNIDKTKLSTQNFGCSQTKEKYDATATEPYEVIIVDLPGTGKHPGEKLTRPPAAWQAVSGADVPLAVPRGSEQHAQQPFYGAPRRLYNNKRIRPFPQPSNRLVSREDTLYFYFDRDRNGEKAEPKRRRKGSKRRSRRYRRSRERRADVAAVHIRSARRLPAR